MTDLEKWQNVNKCETFEDLRKVLLELTDESGQIQGRTRKFDAQKMIDNAKLYYNHPDDLNPNIVTREFGLRQQLMYLKIL